MSEYYTIDPTDPESPTPLAEYKGLRPGSRVLYQNPAWQQQDGSFLTGGMDSPLVITELILFPGMHDGEGYVEAIINEGEWQVNADNLALEPGV